MGFLSLLLKALPGLLLVAALSWLALRSQPPAQPLTPGAAPEALPSRPLPDPDTPVDDKGKAQLEPTRTDESASLHGKTI